MDLLGGNLENEDGDLLGGNPITPSLADSLGRLLYRAPQPRRLLYRVNPDEPKPAQNKPENVAPGDQTMLRAHLSGAKSSRDRQNRSSALRPDLPPTAPVTPVTAQPAQRVEWAANKDAGRLHEDTLFGGVTPVPTAGRSQRVRKQAVQYTDHDTDTGASTRKRKGAGAFDSVDVVADILASLSDPAAVQDARSTA